MGGLKFVEQAIVIAVALAFAVSLVVFFIRSKPDALAEDSAPMPIQARRLLAWYLILLGVVLVYVIAHIGSADFPEVGLSGEVIRETDKPTDAAAPVLDRVYPQTNPADVTVIDFSLFGRNFSNDSRVCFNHLERTPILIGSQRLQTRLEQTNIVGIEPLEIFVVNAPAGATPPSPDAPSPCANPGERKISNTVVIVLRKARAEVSLFGAKVWMSKELQLILLALIAGAIGSYVHAVKSLSDFIGNRTLMASWFWWYITRPFLGSSMALIFYALLRGGFLAGTPADAKAVSPFGVIAVCALVGMFADKAAQKLGEIFDTLFTSKDQRGGKLNAPVIDKLDPESISAGAKAAVPLKIVGDRLSRVTKVVLDRREHVPDSVSDKQVTVTVQRDDLRQPRDVLVSVADPDGASPAKTLHVVSTLKIDAPTGTVDDKLPDATAGQAYQQTFSASGGAAPYQWSVTTPPDFTIDDKGNLAGTRPTKGEVRITIKLTDSDDVTVPRDFKLTVK